MTKKLDWMPADSTIVDQTGCGDYVRVGITHEGFEYSSDFWDDSFYGKTPKEILLGIAYDIIAGKYPTPFSIYLFMDGIHINIDILEYAPNSSEVLSYTASLSEPFEKTRSLDLELNS